MALTGFWALGFLLLVAAQPMRWTVLFDFWESGKGAHTLAGVAADQQLSWDQWEGRRDPGGLTLTVLSGDTI